MFITFTNGVEALLGEGSGVFCLVIIGLGEYRDLKSELTPSLSRDVANFLAAGDIVASLSMLDVFGRGDGL